MNINTIKPVKITVIILISFLFFVTIADATEYTVTPSKNVGKTPGTPFADETVVELQPVPVALVMIFAVFPQLTLINLETLLLTKFFVYIGYSKIKGKIIFSNRKKDAIYQTIIENPGLHFREIQRRTDLKNGTFGYHLRKLENDGLIKPVREKGRVCYFQNNSKFAPDEMKLLSIMNNENLKNIIMQISEKASMNNKEIAESLGISKSIASENLNYLKRTGILNTNKIGRQTFYEISAKYNDIIFNCNSVNIYSN